MPPDWPGSSVVIVFVWPRNHSHGSTFRLSRRRAIAEIGNKTQLLAFILAARFKKPISIIAGILVATLVNHGLAGALGAWITSVVNPAIMRWVLGGSFNGMAIWTLIPDKIG